MSNEPLDQLERQWSEDLGLDMVEQADDASRLSSLVEGALDHTPAVPADASSVGSSGAGVSKPLLVGLGVAVAAALVVAILMPSGPDPVTQPSPTPSVVAEPSEDSPSAELTPAATPTPAADTEAPAEPEAQTPKPEPARPSLDADELFARANAARRGHDYDEAIKLYQRLQREHRGSREAQVSRVALGRLLLDERDKPRKALALFDAYLSKSKTGSLGEEASVGRALALRELGRANAEREAWEQLLERFPHTVHASKARARLKKLQP